MFKSIIKTVINSYGYILIKGPVLKNYRKIYNKYKGYTMVSEYNYYDNLYIADKNIRAVQGAVIECGVWRGGMIAGIAELLGPGRNYYLFDSFEGLPDAKEIDGIAAKKYQENKDDPRYLNNCAAEIAFAQSAMKQTQTDYKLIKGWFKDTLKNFSAPDIALLRLDGDWYESTMDCLVNLYPHVVRDGLIIIDDYYTWDGCSRAVHDYLSQIKSTSRINVSAGGICYIIKKDL